MKPNNYAPLILLAFASASAAEVRDPQIKGEALAERFSIIGQVQPRSAREIAANNWSVGAEAQDRDYSTYSAWRSYLGPLGAKHARLQSGWTRTDKGDGQYDFSWLEPVIDDMLAQGVQPWLSLSYGNERYPGGGRMGRDSPLPTGEGRDAWLRYVTAVATRFKGRVKEYEIWNEPDLNPLIEAAEYGRFAYETTKAIRAVDPKAGVILGAFAHAVWDEQKGRAFLRTSLGEFVKLGGRGYAQALTYHAYSNNPDKVYAALPSFIEAVKAIDPGIEVRQGENGAPSLNQQHYALRNYWWTEEGQAKWLLRRMLGDAAHGVPTSIFTITEMHYPVAAETGLAWQSQRENKVAATTSKHFKGLLETRLYAPGSSEDDRTIVRTKVGYTAMQAITSIFDASLLPHDAKCTVAGSDAALSVYAFRRADGASALAIWRASDLPSANSLHVAVDVHCKDLQFKGDVRFVDPLTRAVYSLRNVLAGEAEALTLRAVPVYDSPVLFVDAELVRAR